LDKDLEEALMLNRRSELIYKHYKKYNSKKALGFCSTRLHAEYMAAEFCRFGVPSVAVYSDSQGEYSIDRREAVKGLADGKFKVIFSVDMFNEGLDIKDIDMVMFLRPTQSPTVFLQQLGRGLRKSKGKEYLNVLDFIGNYKKAQPYSRIFK
jgi:superfamily II DNA or RNA helicase